MAPDRIARLRLAADILEQGNSLHAAWLIECLDEIELLQKGLEAAQRRADTLAAQLDGTLR